MNWQSIQELLKQRPEDFQGYLDRDILLPLLLGEDTADLSYWLGKSLARRLPLAEWDDLVSFFARADWGELSLISQKKSVTELRLQGPTVAKRLAFPATASFSLETGFVAQTREQQLGFLTEASFTVDARHQRVSLRIQTDLKDPVAQPRPEFIQLTTPVADSAPTE
ncbi:YslB family protein [Lapidilactobacillus achengensis]|uniref:YslB family protein n=1 Tax=Lapidilactobacillus achengensis TaxID=2486000 RepID=A0ABW1UJD4_9LACO|nr:YslB family protein [Lapidilactobacillus achengensis]